MSDYVEILDHDDVEDIIREFFSQNIHEYVPSEGEIEGIVESQIEGELQYGSIGDRIDNLESESSDYEFRIQRLEEQEQDSSDFKLLEERVADLERKNARLLDTLGQFAQLLTHRDLI